jgi:hypothetical protein
MAPKITRPNTTGILIQGLSEEYLIKKKIADLQTVRLHIKEAIEAVTEVALLNT